MTARLQVSNLTLSRGTRRVLDGITFTVDPGEFRLEMAEVVGEDGRHARVDLSVREARVAHGLAGDLRIGLPRIVLPTGARRPDGREQRALHGTAPGAVRDEDGTVDVEERAYAAGKIPGSFFRREGRPTEDAILTCRLTDRPLRPAFPDGYRNETQIVITVLGADQTLALGERSFHKPVDRAQAFAQLREQLCAREDDEHGERDTG